jgi:hypothetical protein
MHVRIHACMLYQACIQASCFRMGVCVRAIQLDLQQRADEKSYLSQNGCMALT